MNTFYNEKNKGVPLNHGSVTVSCHAKHQDPALALVKGLQLLLMLTIPPVLLLQRKAKMKAVKKVNYAIKAL